jgi:hypothetical protein
MPDNDVESVRCREVHEQNPLPYVVSLSFVANTRSPVGGRMISIMRKFPRMSTRRATERVFAESVRRAGRLEGSGTCPASGRWRRGARYAR